MKKIKTMYKNGSKVIKFDDTEIEEYEFHQYKKPYFGLLALLSLVTSMIKKLDLSTHSFKT